MTYNDALDTIRETMNDEGISVSEMAQFFVDNQEKLQLSDRDLGIILAGLDTEKGEGLQYLTPEAKKALQDLLDSEGGEGGAEEPAEEPDTTEEPEDTTPTADDEDSDEAAEEDDEDEHGDDDEAADDDEEPEEDDEDEREDARGMFYGKKK